jgi:hypothetical protein
MTSLHSIELEKLRLWSNFDVVAGLASWKNYAPKGAVLQKGHFLPLNRRFLAKSYIFSL